MRAVKGIGIVALVMLGWLGIPGAASASTPARVALTALWADGATQGARLHATGRLSAGGATGPLTVLLERQVRAGVWHPVARRVVRRSGRLQIGTPLASIPRWPVRVRLRVQRANNAVVATSRWRSLAAPAASQQPAAATPTPAPPAPPLVPAIPAAGRPTAPSGTLPVLTIATEFGLPIASTEDYLDANLTLDGAALTAEIRGRGNSTWSMPKRPYRLKLTSKRPLLGMPSNRHWVLLADYADPSLMRNELAFAFGAATRLGWTPRQRAVEVVLNGRYDGVYHLTEHIRPDAARVPISPPDRDDDPTAGGYLLERDETLGEEPDLDCDELGLRPPGFTTPVAPGSPIGNSPIILHEPECHTPQQLDYVRDAVGLFEERLRSAQFADPLLGYSPLINADSFVDWALVQILTANIDAGVRSTWFWLPEGGRITMGPLWDFDLTFGSTYPVEQGWHPQPVEPTDPAAVTAPETWIGRLLEDPAFAEALRTRWGALRDAAVGLRTVLADRAAVLGPAAALNDQLWPRPRSFQDEVDAIDAWLAARIAWLDDELAAAP